MKRNVNLLSILLLAGLVFSFPARAVTTEDIGTSCSTEVVGTSTMTSDGKNIVICLKNDSGDQVWKGMMNSGSGQLKLTSPLLRVVNGVSEYYCPPGTYWVSGYAESCGTDSIAPYGMVCHSSVVPFGSTASVGAGYQDLQCGAL